MSLLYTGYKRSLVIEVYKNGVLTENSPYNGQLPFHAIDGQIYDLLTDDQFKVLSSVDYLQRLQDFQVYVSSLEAGINFTLDVPGTYASRIVGLNCTTTTTTTTSTTTTSTTSTTSTTTSSSTTTSTTSTTSTSTTTTTTTMEFLPPPSMKVLMNIQDVTPSSYTISSISFKGNPSLLSNTITGNTPTTLLSLASENVGTGNLIINIAGVNPSSGTISITNSIGTISSQSYTGPGNYLFAGFIISNYVPVTISLVVVNTTTTTTTTTTSTSTTTTTTTETPSFGNTEQSEWFVKDDCTSPDLGTNVLYVVAANTYSSTTQEAANQLALDDITANGQNYANTEGSCISPSPCSAVTLSSDISVSRTSVSTVEITVTPHISGATPDFLSFNIAVQNGQYWDRVYVSAPSYSDGIPIVFIFSGLDNSHTYLTDLALYTSTPSCSGGYSSASIPNY